MDPVLISAALAAITSIVRQIDTYQRGQMTEDELIAFHERVRDFMHRVQADADTLR